MNATQPYQLAKLEIMVQTPFLTQNSSAGRWGLDAVMARDAHGRLMIAGTLLDGRLRHLALQECTHFAPLLEWLGQPAKDDLVPQRARLYFSDLRQLDSPVPEIAQPKSPSNLPSLTRIQIDPDTGAVKHGALQVIEQAALPGAELHFIGQVRIQLSHAEADTACKLLRAALPLLDSLGALQGIGFGRILKVCLAAPQPPTHQLPTLPKLEDGAPSPQAWQLELGFDESFCFAGRSIESSNLFSSYQHVPGAAIKGALANNWLALHGKSGRVGDYPGFDPLRPALENAFDDLHITDAVWSPPSLGTPLHPLPLSVAQFGKDLYDLAAYACPVLVNGEAPSFQLDWKDDWRTAMGVAALRDYRQASDHGDDWLATEVRVRTAIDPALRRAEDGKLFAYELCAPEATHRFITTLRFGPGTEDREAATQQLLSLLVTLRGTLAGLGKTKAEALIHAIEPCPPVAIAPAPQYTLWLLSPALLLAGKAYASSRALRLAYDAVFKQISGSCLQLSHYYALHEPAGGEYLSRRFGRKDHAPWLLTGAGSVFVLAPAPGKEADAASLLEAWQTWGLPLPGWLKAAGAMDFKHCPFRPQEGFGQVRINDPAHALHAPPPDKVHTIDVEDELV